MKYSQYNLYIIELNGLTPPNHYIAYLLAAFLTTYENCMSTSQNNYKVKECECYTVTKLPECFRRTEDQLNPIKKKKHNKQTKKKS